MSQAEGLDLSLELDPVPEFGRLSAILPGVAPDCGLIRMPKHDLGRKLVQIAERIRAHARELDVVCPPRRRILYCPLNTCAWCCSGGCTCSPPSSSSRMCAGRTRRSSMCSWSNHPLNSPQTYSASQPYLVAPWVEVSRMVLKFGIRTNPRGKFCDPCPLPEKLQLPLMPPPPRLQEIQISF